MVKICGPEDLEALITTAPEDDATCVALREAGVKVIPAATAAVDG